MAFLTEAEAAEFISGRIGTRVTRWTMSSHRNNRTGPPYYKLGGRYFYKPEDIEAWIDASRIDPQEQACEG